jgi:branched-chain amino acid transport system substrate-binding protein
MKKIVVLIALFAVMSGASLFSDASAADQWEIPFLNSWTGPGAGYGILCDYFQKEAVSEINAAGGIAGKPLIMQDCDTGMDPTRAASCMKKAIEKSVVILGPMTSLDTQVCAPIAAKEEVMALSVTGGVETIAASRPWAAVVQGSNRKVADFMMNGWVNLNPDMKKVVMLGLPTVAQWKVRGELQKEYLEKRGVKVLDNIDVAAGAVDVASVAIRTLKSEPDGIVLRLMSGDCARVVAELQKRGFKRGERIFIHESADSPELYTMGIEAGNVLENSYVGIFQTECQTPTCQKLLDGLRKQKGQEKATKLMWGDTFYVATYIIKEAIEKTGVKGDPSKLKEERIKIRDYINSMKNFDSRLWGTISAQPDGGFDVPIYLAQIKGGKPVVVYSSRDYFKN